VSSSVTLSTSSPAVKALIGSLVSRSSDTCTESSIETSGLLSFSVANSTALTGRLPSSLIEKVTGCVSETSVLTASEPAGVVSSPWSSLIESVSFPGVSLPSLPLTGPSTFLSVVSGELFTVPNSLASLAVSEFSFEGDIELVGLPVSLFDAVTLKGRLSFCDSVPCSVELGDLLLEGSLLVSASCFCSGTDSCLIDEALLGMVPSMVTFVGSEPPSSSLTTICEALVGLLPCSGMSSDLAVDSLSSGTGSLGTSSFDLAVSCVIGIEADLFSSASHAVSLFILAASTTTASSPSFTDSGDLTSPTSVTSTVSASLSAGAGEAESLAIPFCVTTSLSSESSCFSSLLMLTAATVAAAPMAAAVPVTMGINFPASPPSVFTAPLSSGADSFGFSVKLTSSSFCTPVRSRGSFSGWLARSAASSVGSCGIPAFSEPCVDDGDKPGL